jgi:hypothetical protein
LKIYNANGVLVKHLTSTIKNQITWYADYLPNGLYILKAGINGKTYTKQLFLMK